MARDAGKGEHLPEMGSWRNSIVFERSRSSYDAQYVGDFGATLSVRELENTAPMLLYRGIKEADPQERLDRDGLAQFLLHTMLGNSGKATRRAAAQTLRTVGPPDRWSKGELLLEALEDPDPEIRWAATYCLGQYNSSDPTKVIGPVLKAMQDERSEIRNAAIQALRPLEVDVASMAVPLLIEALKGESQYEAIQALTWLASEAVDAIPALISLMGDPPSDFVGEDAGRAVLAIDPDNRFDPSGMALPPDEPARTAIRLNFARIGPSARPIRRRLQEYLSRTNKHEEKDSKPSALHPDGPELPGKFWWGGKAYSIAPRPCQLLSAVWDKEQVKIVDLFLPVWGRHTVTDAAIKSALNNMNAVLEKAGVPFEYNRKREFIVKH
jgi:hypothetical protein